MKALVLAAGKGSRLQDLTRNCPKPMLPVQGKPLLEHVVCWLRDHGVTDIALNLHHCPDVITDYFGNGEAWGVTLSYSYEATLLGTAGAAKRLAAFLDEPFVVAYGDVFTNLNLARLIAAHQQRLHTMSADTLATLALYRVPNPTECGLVEMDSTGRVTRFVEKPPADQVFTDLANAGVMVCEPEILRFIPAETSVDFGRDLFPKLLAAGKAVWGQAIAEEEVLIDIGTPNAFQRAQQVMFA
ncbi:MAG TPA: nucleotidyltransferase family protein [Caldilineaceae bacterium]|nr:nucleotidyltransferase family protein [Caldilineaceae bacterium]